MVFHNANNMIMSSAGCNGLGGAPRPGICRVIQVVPDSGWPPTEVTGKSDLQIEHPNGGG